MRTMTIADWTLKTGAILVIAVSLGMPMARADALLDEVVDFTGQIFFIDTKVPAVVIGAVRDGDTAVAGFGERAGPGSPAPDGDTIMRIGSITKAFTGDALAHMDALGLAWIGMMAKDDRPFILQKAGGLQGTFTYIAFAPARNAAVFIALNKFDFGAAFVMGRFANELLEQIAPR